MCDREGTTGMGLNVYTIETGLSICERKCYVCIVHLDPKKNKQEVIALWTGVKGYSSTMYDREGTTGMGLNMGMVYTIETAQTGLSICERKCHVCIAHLDPKASEEEEQKVHS